MSEKDLQKWKNGRATITREEYGKVVSKKMHEFLTCAKLADVGEGVTKVLNELLLEFSASVAAEVFNEERTLEED